MTRFKKSKICNQLFLLSSLQSIFSRNEKLTSTSTFILNLKLFNQRNRGSLDLQNCC